MAGHLLWFPFGHLRSFRFIGTWREIRKWAEPGCPQHRWAALWEMGHLLQRPHLRSTQALVCLCFYLLHLTLLLSASKLPIDLPPDSSPSAPREYLSLISGGSAPPGFFYLVTLLSFFSQWWSWSLLFCLFCLALFSQVSPVPIPGSGPSLPISPGFFPPYWHVLFVKWERVCTDLCSLSPGSPQDPLWTLTVSPCWPPLTSRSHHL